MVEALKVERINGQLSIPGYRHVRGESFEGDAEIVAAHFHVKIDKDDGRRRPEEYPWRASERGIHEIMPASHNTMGALDVMQRMAEDLGLKFTRAAEYEARDKNGKPKHILVVNPKSMPKPGLIVIDANEDFHRQGPDVLTVAAHPDMGTYSVTLPELGYIQTNGYDPEQKFDGIEYNGASQKAGEFGQKTLIRPIRHRFSELPISDLNENVRNFIDAEEDGNTLFEFGGSDGHLGNDFDDVVMLRPADQTTTDSLRNRGVIIFMKEKFNPYYVSTTKKIIFGKLGFK